MSPGPHGAGTPGLSEDRCPAVPAGSCARVLTAGVTGNKEPGAAGSAGVPAGWWRGGRGERRAAALRWAARGKG